MRSGSKSKVLLILILGLALGLRLIGLNQGLWLDEAAQALESRLPVSYLWHHLEIDFHPPLYHLVLHFWLLLSSTEVWLRLLSVIFGLLSVGGILVLGESYQKNSGYLAALLLALNPFHLYYSQEVRPYSLAAAVYLWATIFFLKWLKEKKSFYFLAWILLGIATIYSTYTNFFWLPAVAGFLWVKRKSLSRDQLGLGLTGLILILLSFSFWFPQFRIQLSQGQLLRQTLPGWETAVSPLPLKALPLTVAKFFAGPVRFSAAWWLPLCFAIPVLLGGLALLKQFFDGDELSWLVLKFGVLPLVFLGGLTFFLPVLEPKRAIMFLPFLIVGIGKGLSQARWAILDLLLSFLVADFAYAFNPRWQREQWREAVQWVETQAASKSLVIFAFPAPLAPWEWYSHSGLKALGVLSGYKPALPLEVETPLVSHLDAEKIFHFHYLADLTDPQGEIGKFLTRQSYQVEETKDFAGVGFIDLYQR